MEQYIEIRNFDTGSRIAILTAAIGTSGATNGFYRVKTLRAVNAPGVMQVEVGGDWPLLWSLPDKTQFILWRRDQRRGIDWYREFVGLYRDVRYTFEKGRRVATLTCPGLMSILGWYHVLWPAGMANRSTFTSVSAETIIKTLVQYNCVSSSATATNGRDRNVSFNGLTIETNANTGNALNYTANRSRTVLEECQRVAQIGGGDFDVVYASPTSRQLRWHFGQLGADKSNTIVFAEDRGNIDRIEYSISRSTSVTTMVVAGRGEATERSVTVRNAANYSSTNEFEGFADGRSLNPDTPSARATFADQKLHERRESSELTFQAVQTDGSYYGPNGYTLGDLVSIIRPDGVKLVQQVSRVQLDFSSNGESIVVEGATR